MKKTLLAIILFTIALSAQAQVTTLYGNGQSGYSVSGTNADSVSCRFNLPYGCAFDTKGNLWITDQADNYVVMINSGTYELREGYNAGGFYDGASLGQFGGVTYNPEGIVVVPGKTSASDQIYLCDAGNNAIRKIDSFVSLGDAQPMTTVAGGGVKSSGSLGKSGYVNGTGANSLFSGPVGIGYVKDANGGYLVVADNGNNAVRKVSLHRSDYGTTSDITTTIQSPLGIFVDNANNIYVASSTANQGIEKISNTGTVSTVVSGTFFEAPTSVVVKGTDMYIADNCHIAYFDMTQPASLTNPSVLAGDPLDTSCSFKDGTDAAALFNGINTLTLSPDSSYLIVADASNNRFRKVIIPVPHVHNSGIEPGMSNNTFNIYPNPASGYVNINSKVSGNADIALVNMTGKQVLINKSVQISAGQPYNFDLQNQPSGIYILQVTTNSGTYNNKIVVR